MQRYSDGLAVPKLKIDIFTGKTTDGAGAFTCELTYTPQSIRHILVPPVRVPSSGDWRNFYKHSLAGKTLTLYALRMQYERTDTPTGTANSGAAGADPHSHVLTETRTEVEYNYAATEEQGAISIVYQVA